MPDRPLNGLAFGDVRRSHGPKPPSGRGFKFGGVAAASGCRIDCGQPARLSRISSIAVQSPQRACVLLTASRRFSEPSDVSLLARTRPNCGTPNKRPILGTSVGRRPQRSLRTSATSTEIQMVGTSTVRPKWVSMVAYQSDDQPASRSVAAQSHYFGIGSMTIEPSGNDTSPALPLIRY